MHMPVFYVAALGISILLSMSLVIIIVLWQRSTMTRILALDTLSALLVALLALYAHAYRSPHYLDVALILALLAFIGTLASAQYHSTGRLFAAAPVAPGLLSSDVLGPLEGLQPLLDTLLLLAADGLILLGLCIMSVAIYGMLWLPDIYTRLHAASKINVFGVIPILLATLTTGEPEIICKALLIAAFLLLTVPVSSHAIAHAARLSGERVEAPDTEASPTEAPAARQRVQRHDQRG